MEEKVINFTNVNEVEDNKEEEEMLVKTGWSLKKKLLIGAGAVVGIAAGALALGAKKTTVADQVMDNLDGVSFDEDVSEDQEDQQNE